MSVETTKKFRAVCRTRGCGWDVNDGYGGKSAAVDAAVEHILDENSEGRRPYEDHTVTIEKYYEVSYSS